MLFILVNYCCSLLRILFILFYFNFRRRREIYKDFNKKKSAYVRMASHRKTRLIPQVNSTHIYKASLNDAVRVQTLRFKNGNGSRCWRIPLQQSNRPNQNSKDDDSSSDETENISRRTNDFERTGNSNDDSKKGSSADLSTTSSHNINQNHQKIKSFATNESVLVESISEIKLAEKNDSPILEFDSPADTDCKEEAVPPEVIRDSREDTVEVLSVSREDTVEVLSVSREDTVEVLSVMLNDSSYTEINSNCTAGMNGDELLELRPTHRKTLSTSPASSDSSNGSLCSLSDVRRLKLRSQKLAKDVRTLLCDESIDMETNPFFEMYMNALSRTMFKLMQRDMEGQKVRHVPKSQRFVYLELSTYIKKAMCNYISDVKTTTGEGCTTNELFFCLRSAVRLRYHRLGRMKCEVFNQFQTDFMEHRSTEMIDRLRTDAIFDLQLLFSKVISNDEIDTSLTSAYNAIVKIVTAFVEDWPSGRCSDEDLMNWMPLFREHIQQHFARIYTSQDITSQQYFTKVNEIYLNECNKRGF